MAVLPYTPTPFATPVVNPAIGGFGDPVPYISTSMYVFAPTALDTTNLVPAQPQAAQTRALADVIRRASAEADRICFGADAAAKDVSLAATLSVETTATRVKNGELRLICDYRPILQVVGVDVGPNMASLATVGPTIAAQIRIGRRTIYVPYCGNVVFPSANSGDSPAFVPGGWGTNGSATAVWSYVNGYPHTYLLNNITAGDSTCTVASTDGNGGLYGMIPGTQPTIYDAIHTETFTVGSVTGNVITLPAGQTFQYSHVASPAPDFLPVTCIPEDVHNAVIHLTSSCIKDRGDNAVTWTNAGRQSFGKNVPTPGTGDYAEACRLLESFKVRNKQKN